MPAGFLNICVVKKVGYPLLACPLRQRVVFDVLSYGLSGDAQLLGNLGYLRPTACSSFTSLNMTCRESAFVGLSCASSGLTALLYSS